MEELPTFVCVCVCVCCDDNYMAETEAAA
jgi:hypothetical protein